MYDPHWSVYFNSYFLLTQMLRFSAAATNYSCPRQWQKFHDFGAVCALILMKHVPVCLYCSLYIDYQLDAL